MKIELTAWGVPELQREPAILGQSFKLGSWSLVWWGFSQWYKWRRHSDHIDCGVFSVYGFRKNHPFWRFIGVLIKPMRWNYHRRFCRCKP